MIALSTAIPAAACHDIAGASSTVQSCESGVKVYRGQQSGPDFRYAALEQNRNIAEARAREAEARARIAEARAEQARLSNRRGFAQNSFGQNNFPSNGAFRRAFLVPQVGFGFRNLSTPLNLSSPVVGGDFTRGRLAGRGLSNQTGLTAGIRLGTTRFIPGATSRPPAGR